MQNQKKAYLYAICAVILWSSVATAFKISLSFLSVLELLFIASFISLACIFIICVKTKQLQYLKTLDKKQIYIMLLLGLINPVAYYLVLFQAYSYLPAQIAQSVNYTWALMLSYLSFFILKKPLSKKDILSGFICYFGVFIICTHGNFLNLHANISGIFYALISTILWALYWALNTKYTTNAILGLLLNFTSGFIVLFILMFFNLNFEHFNLKGILGATYVGIFEMGITFYLWLKALQLAQNTSKIANLIFISPFLSLIFIYFLLHEKIYISTLIGLCFIVLGLLYQQNSFKNK